MKAPLRRIWEGFNLNKSLRNHHQNTNERGRRRRGWDPGGRGGTPPAAAVPFHLYWSFSLLFLFVYLSFYASNVYLTYISCYIYHIFIFHLYQIANKWYPKNKNLLPETQLSENVYFSYFFQWFLKNEFYIEPKKKPLKLEYITRSRASACNLKSIDLLGIWRNRSKKNDPPPF